MKYIFLLLASVVLLSCSKDSDNNTPSNKTRTELLVDKKWQKFSMSGKLSDGTLSGELFNTIPESGKDDYIIFKSGSALRFEIHDNQNRDPDEPEELYSWGTWSLINSDQYLVLTHEDANTSPTVTLQITELTESLLKWEATIEENGTTIYESYKPIQ